MTTSPEDMRKRVMEQHEALQREKDKLADASKAAEILNNLGPDEPFFVFRAKDILSSLALDEYAKFVEKFNPDSPQLVSLMDAIEAFRWWQRHNPDKVKLPD